MPHDITIPRLGWSMEEGVLGRWLKSPGEWVRAGEALFTLEGDKAAQDIESLDTGYLCIPADAPRTGDPVKVGQVIGFLLAEGETVPASVRHASLAPAPTAPAASASVAGGLPRAAMAPRSARTTASRPIASPRARRRAQELGIDWTLLTGTGRDGRIRERDVLNCPHTARMAPPLEVAPASPGRHAPATKRRSIVAQRMVAGVTQAAPVTLTTKVDAGRLVDFRSQLKQSAPDGPAPSYNDIILYLVARTLRAQPQLNACWHRDGIYTYDEIHIATAVDTELGLLAPVIRHADRLSLEEIAERTRQLKADARLGRLHQQHLEGGTFTVTNLGMFGIDAFTPILNLPQAGILGVGRIVAEPLVRAGQVVVGHTLSLSLTFDHRVVDGAPAARWLQTLCQRVVALKVETET